MKTNQFVAAFFWLMTTLLLGCHKEKHLDVVRIAAPPFLSSGLIFLAKDQKLFEDAGVNVQLDILPYGRDCLNQMLENKYDLSAVYVSPLASSITQKKELAILTELHSSGNNTKLIFRKDLVQPVDGQLTNIKVGLVKGTNAEFLLSLYLAVNSIPPSSITVVDRDVDELEKLLLNGKIQAAIFWQPRVSKLLSTHTDKLSAMEISFYTDFSALVGNNAFINQNKKTTAKVIKALIEAKKTLDKHPKRSYQIISKYLDDKSILDNDKLIEDFSLELGLSQMFKVMLESEVNWKKKLFLKERFTLEENLFFRTEFIKKFIPEKVTIE